jgi:hypothetical protein
MQHLHAFQNTPMRTPTMLMQFLWDSRSCPQRHGSTRMERLLTVENYVTDANFHARNDYFFGSEGNLGMAANQTVKIVKTEKCRL